MTDARKNINGAEKLFRRMNDRAYSEAFDLPEDAILNEDYIPEEDEIDHEKDTAVKGR
ncbi:MAG: hypothetical protein J1F63_05310 [Oscillospiraceae bacterium]|nr:hypothetical protein [Oscillospiraceae bacterium]